MITPQRCSPKTPYSLGLIQRALLFPLGLVYRIWLLSIRFKFLNQDIKCKVIQDNHPVIITLWHNRLFLAGEWQRRFRKNRKCFGLISASKDGAWLEAFYDWSGIYSIRGSSNRGGAKAIRDLVRVLKRGNDIGITPDGSRGPCYNAKPGCLLVGKLSKVPLLLLGFEYGRHFKLKSWDRFVIPFPFSQVFVSMKLVYADDFIEGCEIDEAANMIGQELMKVTTD